MWAITPYLLPLAIIVSANLAESRRAWRLLTFASLFLINAAVFVLGLLILALPALSRLTQVPLSPALAGFSFAKLGAAAVVTAVLGLFALLNPVRRWLASYLHIDPDSPVHTTALVLLLYLSVSSIGVLVGAGPWLMEGLESANLSPWAVVSGQVVFVLFALAGTGFGLRRNARQALRRLGLGPLTLRYLGIAALAVLLFLVLDYVTALLWQRIWPLDYRSIMDSSQQLFGGFGSPLGALTLALAAGIGEETLFRGALQPVFRIPLTALAFTLGHVQYGLSPATVEILLIGLALGWLRTRTNTTTCMVVHIAYNFLDLLIMPLFP